MRLVREASPSHSFYDWRGGISDDAEQMGDVESPCTRYSPLLVHNPEAFIADEGNQCIRSLAAELPRNLFGFADSIYHFTAVCAATGKALPEKIHDDERGMNSSRWLSPRLVHLVLLLRIYDHSASSVAKCAVIHHRSLSMYHQGTAKYRWL